MSAYISEYDHVILFFSERVVDQKKSDEKVQIDISRIGKFKDKMR